ncbi:hypothetical protein SeMB42_g06785 [Synchytrium endobioticum]|nr:hypothetical protein SeMB42_g06787 [Synchytrium endobioticum]TPX37937.1 hypothetical protein SeMB42_g06785 [Synchytrium endobioticum]
MSTSTLTKTRLVSANAPIWTDEYEFDALDECFDAIIVQVNKRTLLKESLVASLVLPVALLEPDSKLHESWYPLASATSADAEMSKSPKSPHVWKTMLLAAPCICLECSHLMCALNRESQVRCEACGATAHARCAGRALPNCGHVGTMRLQYTYTREPIMPSNDYEPIKAILLHENMLALSLFGKVCEDREDVAKHLLTLLDSRGLARTTVCRLCQLEIQDTKDPNTIFRGNSLATKCLDVYMKRVGMNYLHGVLQPIIKEIIKQNRIVEIDPIKRTKTDNEAQEEAETVLMAYVQWTMREILASSKRAPPGMKAVFRSIREEISHKFPADKIAIYTAVTSFIFLRFFNAAILGPKLFDLVDTLPSTTNARTLALISKCCQQAANFVPFDGRKEPYMKVCNAAIEAFFPQVRQFVDELCGADARLKHGGTRARTILFACCMTRPEAASVPASPAMPAGAVTSEFATTAKQGQIEKSLAALSRHVARVSAKLDTVATTAAEKDECLRLLDAVSNVVTSQYATERKRITEEALEKRRADFNLPELPIQSSLVETWEA